MSPHAYYNSRLEEFQQSLKKLNRLSSRWAALRVVVFVSFLTGIVYLLNGRALQPAGMLTVLLILMMAVLIKQHSKIKQKLGLVKNSAFIAKLERDKLQGNYELCHPGTKFKDDQHPYSADLDLFGQTSVFQLLNQTTSFFGTQKLASWLLHIAPQPELEQRQQAAKELSNHPDWCLNYRAAGMGKPLTEAQAQVFKQWLQQPPRLVNKPFWRWMLVMMPSLLAIITGGAYLFNYSLWANLPILFIAMGLLGKHVAYAGQTVESTYKALTTLKMLEKQLLLLEQSLFTSSYLLSIKENVTDKGLASHQIKELNRWLDYLQARNSSFHPLFNIPFLLDIRWLLKLEYWRLKNKTRVNNWFDSLGTMESLISLAGLYFNQPNWVTPVFSKVPYLVEAKDLVHPMLGKQGVGNHLKMQGKGNTLLVTGPNMAGKSTFMRTVATSIVLAQTGAPVRASYFNCNPAMQVFTAMRIKDNLSENISSFYAELARINLLIELLKQGEPCMYFLDEILKGTNSADRHKGAEALIKQLHKLGSSGIISTHDLALGELASHENFVHNVSFESEINQGKITFDYRLKEGICSSFNACELMRQMGIEVT